MSRTSMSNTTSPSSCPDLDFSDCLPTSLPPSPRQRRPRGAPWASKRPKPFVDRPNACEQVQDADLCLRTLEQLQQNEYINLPHSPLKRRAANQICEPEWQELQPAHSTDSDELFHLLFPEVCRLQDADDKQIVQSSNSKQSVIGQGSNHSPKTRNEDNQFDESQHTQSYDASRLPVTPERLHPHHETSNEQVVDTGRPTTRSNYKTKFTYSSKKNNKNVLRSAAIKQFEDITGVTTSSRIKAAATRQSASECESEEEARPREHIASSPSQESIQASSNSTTVSKNTHHHEVNVNYFSSRHIHNAADLDTVTPQADHDQMSNTVELSMYVTLTRTSARLARRRKHQSSDNFVGPPLSKLRQSAYLERDALSRSAPASSSSCQAEHQEERLDDQEGPPKVTAKDKKYKQYVYEKLLDYPPRFHEQDDLRPGYKPLEMAYLIPPPCGRLHDGRFNPDSQDDETIRELRLMILGRISQTEFKSIQDQAVKARNKPGTSRRKKAQDEVAQLYDSEDDTSRSVRKKPLSHLNMNTIANNQTLPALEAAVGQGGKETHIKRKTKVDKRQVLLKGKRNTKKAQLAPGHLPLQLQYSNANTGIRDVTREPRQEDSRENGQPRADKEHMQIRSILAARAHTSENIAIQEVVQDTSSRPKGSLIAADTSAHHDQTSSQKSQRNSLQPQLAERPLALSAPAPRTSAIEGKVSSRSTEQKDLDLCDILMPMSPQTRKPSSVRPFTLRTTNTTRYAYQAMKDRSIVDNESFRSLPSALWYDENEEEYESSSQALNKIDASYIEVHSRNEATSRTSVGRAILAPSSSCISDYKKQSTLAASTELKATRDRYSQSGSLTRSLLAMNDKDQALATASSVRKQSSGLADWDDAYEEYPSPSYQSVSSANFEYDGPTPLLGEAHSHNISMRNNLLSTALTLQRDNLPAGHQPCYTPSSDYWHECTKLMQTVPSDIEWQYHEYPEGYQHDCIAFPLEDIPPPQPAPATPEDEFMGAEMSLQTKLGAYGRRIVELEPLYIKAREGPVKGKIPQGPTPPENQQVQTLGMHTVTNNQRF